MDVQEYCAKSVLAASGVAVPKGLVANSVEEGVQAFK